ncbi:hypothetical protein DPEC_G00024140 [Dallia pectoralis]|uniref:Uncharacterized protein n=1 Tax=Dallia pectoralis TaxID=75939 RepID=A0ACC2HHL5_DALPE|nr:hypothetical protein DPEC_G00024140 [Dallia pectoralis]
MDSTYCRQELKVTTQHMEYPYTHSTAAGAAARPSGTHSQSASQPASQPALQYLIQVPATDNPSMERT